MKETDIAWFAGIFEGEGCMSIGRNGATRLAVAMTDRDVIERIHSLFPTTCVMGVIHPKPRAGGGPCKTQYGWRVGRPDEVKRILELILPYFGLRRSARAREVLDHLATRPGMGGYQRAKTHCPQGHEYTPENTTYRGDGDSQYRACATCLREWWGTGAAKVADRRRIVRESGRVCQRCDQWFERTNDVGRAPTFCPDCRVLQRHEAHARCVSKRRDADSQPQLAIHIPKGGRSDVA